MPNDPNIQDELKALDSVLVNISNTNVYTVPEGYFETIPNLILHSVTHKSGVLPGNPTVPEGYFEGLAESILKKIRLEAVPENEYSILLQPLRTRATYSVPGSYFDGLAAEVMNKINTADESGERSELLEPVKHINPYSLPAGYFETLAPGITAKLQQPAKVLIMRRRTSFFKYAAAAVITGILGLSVISIVDKKQQEMIIPSSASVMEEANAIIKTNSFESAFSALSDGDIENYLKNSGEDINAALVASAAEDKTLPDELDYITNDNTLDNLLNELNIKDQPANN